MNGSALAAKDIDNVTELGVLNYKGGFILMVFLRTLG